MPKVICTLPNASDEMNGVKFSKHPDRDDAVVSEEISQAQAEYFASVSGFELVGAKKEPQAPVVTQTQTATPDAEAEAAAAEEERKKAEAEAEAKRQADSAAAEFEELRAKLVGLGATPKSSWKVDRLRVEVEKAERAAAEKLAQQPPAEKPAGAAAEDEQF